MKPRILIVHGIHHTTNESAPDWMDHLVSAFRDTGWDAAKWTYGYAYALLTGIQNPGRAKKLAELIQPGDVVLGHSNGCCLAWMAAELGAPIGGAILLNPALDCDKVMAKQVPWVNLYANHYDEAVPLTEFPVLRKLFFSTPWGEQGRNGISVKDDRYQTVWTDSEPPRVYGHSGVLAPGAISVWASRMIRDAEDRAPKAKRKTLRRRVR